MTALRKILVVDDDPVVGHSFTRVLGSKGYAVITAANGAEALAKIAAEEYDVVYTDIRMPGMDGIEVAATIKDRQPWLPVVIVSGYATPENEAKARAAGVSAVLHKPLSPELIEGSARDALIERSSFAAAAPAVAAPAVEVPGAAGKGRDMLKVAALTVAAPFIGLAYVVAFPVIGLAMLVWLGVQAFARRAPRVARFMRNLGLLFAAPFVGLAYAIALPFVGLGMLAWMGTKAARARAAK
jgi:CheY-like chemotaxis protein